MTLRTPRRRISPRTKRRYRAIRDFLRRAIGSASQQDLKINSGIALNVSSLKHKIFGLERKKSEANKGCDCQHGGAQDSLQRESASTLRTEVEKEQEDYREQRTSSPSCRNRNIQDLEQLSESSSARVETDTNYQRVDDEAKPRMSNAIIPDKVPFATYDDNNIGYKKKRSKHKLNAGVSHALLRSPSITTYENRVLAYSTTSIEVPNPAKYNRNNKRDNRPSSRRDFLIDDPTHFYLDDLPKYQDNKKQRTESPTKRQARERQRKSNSKIPEGTLDREFIDDLIKRQYSPVRRFDRKTSDISQFTEPVCRDRAPRKQKDTCLLEDPNMSSCYQLNPSKQMYVQDNDLNNKLSVCDARLYGNKRRSRSRHHRNIDVYDSKYYDVIPVKEKASPKSRRKFVEENLFHNDRSAYYVEVPPSPRSNRPRLNLRAQYYDQYDDYMVRVPPINNSRSPMKVRKVYIPVETDITSDSHDQEAIPQARIRPKCSKNCLQEEVVPQPHEMYHTYSDVQDNFVINDNLINKTQEVCTTESKTDKALSEIKDLLQTFLNEIKSNSLSKSDSSKNESIQACEQTLPSTASVRGSNPSNNLNSFQNFNPVHANVPGPMPTPIPGPFIPPMTNPCYPVLPMCPMQPGYVMPTPSFTCTACLNSCAHCPIHKTSGETTCKENNEIDDLIKEIHKLVAKKERKESYFRSNTEDLSARTNAFTRSGGGSCHVQHQDAQVGTTRLRCYSKSCEAIGSAMVVEGYPANVSYSDTVLERMSLNPSVDTTSFDTQTTTEKNKVKQRLNLLLKSLGLLKKKKKATKHAIEVISEADNRAFVERTRTPPFPSEVTNYMMYGQEFTRPPPHPPRTPHRSPRHYCPYGDHEHELGKYNHYSMREPIADTFPRRSSPLRYERGRGHSPSAPPYSASYVSNPYLHPSQQGPLCLREVEVKSIATQSEVKKPSFFGKFAKKTQQTAPPMVHAVPTAATPFQPPPLLQQQAKRQGFFSRGNNVVSNAPSAAQPVPSRLDTWKYQLKMQQELANKDQNIRNVLIKKLFSKRNPFSPRNPIIKTILGKDTEYDSKYLKFGAVKPKMLF